MDKHIQIIFLLVYIGHESEATNEIAALPLKLRDELNLDPGCFFHRLDYHSILDGVWNKDTREYKNESMVNQEQYLKDLDECFTVNRVFFPDMVVIDNPTTTELQVKQWLWLGVTMKYLFYLTSRTKHCELQHLFKEMTHPRCNLETHPALKCNWQ
jgi:hypothetical protein